MNKCPHVLIHWTASILQYIIKLAPQCFTFFYMYSNTKKVLKGNYIHSFWDAAMMKSVHKVAFFLWFYKTLAIVYSCRAIR